LHNSSKLPKSWLSAKTSSDGSSVLVSGVKLTISAYSMLKKHIILIINIQILFYIIVDIIFYIIVACLQTATSWALILYLYVVQIETWCYTRAESGTALSKVSARIGIGIMELKKKSRITKCRFDNWKPSKTAFVRYLKRVWYYTDCVLVALNVNDNDDDEFNLYVSKLSYTQNFIYTNFF